MKSLKNIVVGIDFSKDSASALLEAIRIAAWEGATVHAIHVFDARIYQELTEFNEFQGQEAIDKSHQALRDWVGRTAGNDHAVDCHFTVGYPLEEVLRAVEAHSADLLVLGAHGINHAFRNKIGSLAGKCTRKSQADVLLVRAQNNRPFAKIVTCVDFSANSLKAARHAIHIAQMDGAPLEFLHVHQPVAQYIAASPDYVMGAINLTAEHDELVEKELKVKLEQTAANLVDEAGGCTFSTHVARGVNVRGAILDHLTESPADLVVVGVRGHSKFRHMLLGTTAEKVIRNAKCSTLAVRPDGFDYRSVAAAP